MAIDLHTETIIRLSEVANLPFMKGRVPGKKLSRATLWRWALSGKLETFQAGASRLTSVEACERFCARSQPGAAPVPTPTPLPTLSRKRAIERAKLELEKIGI